MRDRILTILLRPLLWMSRIVFKVNRLDAIDPVCLGAELSAAIELYGDPIEKGEHEKLPEATTYTFEAGIFHEAVITVWQDRIHQITYWSSYPAPEKDLRFMFEKYAEGNTWRVMTEGYSYQRSDDKVHLWCSAVPAIGVGTIVFMNALREFRRTSGDSSDGDGLR